MDLIRNFSIIAHIDHGKSTLADRIIQLCGGLSDREMEAQVLDSMDIERERGITIKAQTAALNYKAKDGKVYNINLIDTPGHVDFSYEVSRSLSACEGALLVVDASQGVEAQTVANCYMALELGVEVVPVLNKIDLPQADPERAKKEIEDVIGIDASEAVTCSAKTGMGVQDVIEEMIAKVPSPKGDPKEPRKIIVDTYGGAAPHGGGAFSGKDPSKVDRSAAYASRYVAKNIVAAGLASRCMIQISYAIGVAKPTSVMVETYGTGKIPDEKITDLVNAHFDLRPKGIVNMLDLLRPIYRKTASYGHFGREEPEFTWERTDKAAILRDAAGLPPL